MIKIFKLSATTFFLTLFLKVSPIFAVGGSGLDGRFDGWLEEVLIWIISIAGIVAVAVLVFNAFLFITASGDEGRVAKATKGITYAIVGLVIAAIAFLIVNFVIEQLK